jgi:hypothetical protein
MWVVCEADGNSSASGSSAKPANSRNGQSSSKPVCTVKKMEPQPPEGDIFWEGKSSKGRAVYERTCQNGPGRTPVNSTFVADEAGGVPAIDPAVVAEQAVSKMKLSGPDITSPRAAGKYIVGVPMWMWVHQSTTTYGPNSATATAGGVTVTATAKVTMIAWQMGDGSTLVCHGPGEQYAPSYGKRESPTCGHTYTRTSASQSTGKYTVTATSTWTVNWQVSGVGGENGQLVETRQSQMQVTIGELQVVR